MSALDLVKHFYKEWRTKYGTSYPASFAKHGAMFKRLLSLREVGGDTASPIEGTGAVGDLRSYISFYFSGFSDPFAVKAGHSLEVFISQLPKVIAAMKERDARRIGSAEVNEDYKLIEEARKTK